MTCATRISLHSCAECVCPRPRVDNLTLRSSVLTASEAGCGSVHGGCREGSHVVTNNGSLMPLYFTLAARLGFAALNEASHTKRCVCCCNFSASSCRALTYFRQTIGVIVVLKIPIGERSSMYRQHLTVRTQAQIFSLRTLARQTRFLLFFRHLLPH